METYVSLKGNKGQVSWLWKKVWTATGHGESFQQFLDSNQYTLNGILRLVAIEVNAYVCVEQYWLAHTPGWYVHTPG